MCGSCPGYTGLFLSAPPALQLTAFAAAGPRGPALRKRPAAPCHPHTTHCRTATLLGFVEGIRSAPNRRDADSCHMPFGSATDRRGRGTAACGFGSAAVCGWHGATKCAGGTGERVVREPLTGRVTRGRRAAREERTGRRARDPDPGTGPARAITTETGPAHTRTEAAQPLRSVRDLGKKKPGHPRGAGSARAVGRTGQRAGRPGPDGVGQLHPVVSPQFSHLWQVPLRTVSQPQRGQGGASGVELRRR